MGFMKFFSGFVLGSSLIACAATPISFAYKYYNISGNLFQGTLLGPTPQDDVPFQRCAPVNGKQQCVVVFYTELNTLIADYKNTKQSLVDCQAGK